jgi:hypothetical protein
MSNSSYKVHEVSKANPIGKHQFYNEHVSQSLPLIMREQCQDWGIFMEVQQKQKRKTDLDDFMATMFSFNTKYHKLLLQSAFNNNPDVVKEIEKQPDEVSDKPITYTRLTKENPQDPF